MNTSPLIITISRQLGSGGAYIGKQLSKRLDIAYVDREIITQTAKKISVLEAEVESRDEKMTSFWEAVLQQYRYGFQDAFVPPSIYIPTDYDLFDAEAQVIERISKEYSAVIIGRCGSFILREHPNHLSVFLHADVEFRRARVQEIYNISGKNADKMIVQYDEQRQRYHHKLTGKDWTDARQYNLSIDTGKIGFEKSLEIILNYQL